MGGGRCLAYTVDNVGSYFPCLSAFAYSLFQFVRRLRNRNRSPARTVTKRGRDRMVTFSVTGEASGRGWKSVESISIFST
jgi:hypothetical protein